jgi:hypothetical protein
MTYIIPMTSKSSPQSLIAQAAQIPHLERGKLSIIRQGPDGPYYNHQFPENGKYVTRYVPRDQSRPFSRPLTATRNLTG